MPFAVVTGASTGIGRDAALRLDARGWTVFAGVRKDSDAEALRSAASERLRAIQLDVTDPEHIAAAEELVRNEVGDQGLDALVNNAGIGGGGPLELIELDAIRRVFEVNVFGVVRCAQAFVPLLRIGQPGRVVNVSSIGGRWAGPYLAPYHMSKWAVEAMSDSLRMELAPWGIEVSVIEPGTITTEIWKKADHTIQGLIDAMDEETDALYGDAIRDYGKVVLGQQQQGVPPSAVSDVIEHALTASRPKTRYLVGPGARLIHTLRWLLPDRVFDGVMTRAIRSRAE